MVSEKMANLTKIVNEIGEAFENSGSRDPIECMVGCVITIGQILNTCPSLAIRNEYVAVMKKQFDLMLKSSSEVFLEETAPEETMQ
jgi:hypothetical protein